MPNTYCLNLHCFANSRNKEKKFQHNLLDSIGQSNTIYKNNKPISWKENQNFIIPGINVTNLILIIGLLIKERKCIKVNSSM